MKTSIREKTIKPDCCLLLSPFYALRAHKTIFFPFFLILGKTVATFFILLETIYFGEFLNFGFLPP